jgi:hypothetical protein
VPGRLDRLRTINGQRRGFDVPKIIPQFGGRISPGCQAASPFAPQKRELTAKLLKAPSTEGPRELISPLRTWTQNLRSWDLFPILPFP